jgi:hypothetical protein
MILKSKNSYRLNVYRDGILIGDIFLPEDELQFPELLKKRISHLKQGEYDLIGQDGSKYTISLTNSLSFCMYD